MEAPVIHVGIMTGTEISFTLNGKYKIPCSETILTGKCRIYYVKTLIYLECGDFHKAFVDQVNIVPLDAKEGSFTLHDVTIGINFHWERKEDQVFKGTLKFIADEGQVQAINILSIEDYLKSVISSEMSATSSMELLKAHAVISRSWLLAQVQKNKKLKLDNQIYQSVFRSDDELIRWYDREDHVLFDVCADDHCQRYQGITRSTTPLVEEAVNKTSGEILAYGGEICDARFSKCCGGITEIFENAWEPVNHPYLQKIVDSDHSPENFNLDLEQEDAAFEWIMGQPDAFCHTSDKKVLQQVLNDYDQETNDFFRWKVDYTQKELSDLVTTRTGIDFGVILDLIPVQRGVSGRLTKLKIVGTLKTMTIGKELEIRKSLSKSHLYSSAFVVEKIENNSELHFVLHGAGWGNGVGLCQIGAAVMGDKGYLYSEILMHYFRGATLERRY